MSVALQDVILGSWLNVLLLFVPLAILAAAYFGPVPTFIFACFALISLSERLTYVTEQLALYATPTIGGLLNATFGNLGELLFIMLALNQGLVNLSQLFLLGSILGNLLLVLGMSFLIGGIKHYEQKFPAKGTVINMGTLLLGTLALLVPSLLFSTQTAVGNVFVDIAYISRVCSIVLLLLYVAFLAFQLVTHVHIFDEDESTFLSRDMAKLGLWSSVAWLFFFALVIAVMAELIVETTEVVAETLSLPDAFVAIILLPIVANIAEHASAIIFAYRNQMSITLTVCIGSSLQIMIFVIPVSVLYSWAIGGPFLTLQFQAFETVMLFSTVVVTSVLIQDGQSNWFKGVLLLLVYAVAGIGFWFHEVDISPNGPRLIPRPAFLEPPGL